MPFLTIHTNAKAENVEVFTTKAAEWIAHKLHKPINYVIVTYDCKSEMCFGGKMENKGALVEMKSIGFADKRELAKELTDFLVQELKAQPNFINIEFIDMPASTLAIGGNLMG